MAKYAPKKIEFVFEQVKAKPEEIEQRLSDAFAILFEETLKSIKDDEEFRKEVEIKNAEDKLYKENSTKGWATLG